MSRVIDFCRLYKNSDYEELKNPDSTPLPSNCNFSYRLFEPEITRLCCCNRGLFETPAAYVAVAVGH